MNWKIYHDGKRKKVYISGPISGYNKAERYVKFRDAYNILLNLGYCPINPMFVDLGEDASWQDYMREDIALLVQCDMIYFLPNWEKSEGAKIEATIAQWLGIETLDPSKLILG